jgi:hypothetical protein
MCLRRVTTGFTWFCLLAFSAAGCSSAPAVIQAKPIEAYEFRQTQGGVRVAVDPYLTVERTQLAFRGGESFPESGLLPIQVSIENGGREEVKFDPRDFSLARPKSGVELPLSAAEAFSLTRLSVGWWAALPILGPSSVAVRNEPRQKDLESRELREGTVAPGGSTSGFLYFRIAPEDGDLAGSVVVAVLRTAGGRGLTYEIPIAGRRDIPIPASPTAASVPQAGTPPAPTGQGTQRPTRIEGAGGGVIIRSPSQ